MIMQQGIVQKLGPPLKIRFLPLIPDHHRRRVKDIGELILISFLSATGSAQKNSNHEEEEKQRTSSKNGTLHDILFFPFSISP